MQSNRRKFISTALIGGASAAALPLSACWLENGTSSVQANLESRYDRLDEILKQPVFKRNLFPSPVIIETLELLRYKNSYLCRVRSADGAVGISVAHSGISTYFPIFLKKLQPFFMHKDARDLDLILEKVFFYR